MTKKINKRIVDLICELEYLVGNNCYNPNSYDGWTGDEGCSYRYPVYISDEDRSERKTRFTVDSATADNIHTLKYKFGSNHLYIGNGIIDVLNEIEERYNLDFVKLEIKRSNKEVKEVSKKINGIFKKISSSNKDFLDYYYDLEEMKDFLDKEYDYYDYERKFEEIEENVLEEINRKCRCLYLASTKLNDVLELIDEEKNDDCILNELQKTIDILNEF